MISARLQAATGVAQSAQKQGGDIGTGGLRKQESGCLLGAQCPEARGVLLSEEGAHHTSAHVKFSWNGAERAPVCAEAELENFLSC